MRHGLANMPANDFWMWTIALILVALVGFFFAFRSLRKARIIEDTPTARIRSAHQGYVELNGVARYLEDSPCHAGLTGKECCWYRFHIQKKGDKNWRTVESGSSDEFFVVHDETGDCIIDPLGAEVTSTVRNVWYGGSRHPENSDPPLSRSHTFFGFHVDFHVDSSRGLRFGSHYRYTEERIHLGDPLYAIGYFKTMDDMDHNANRQVKLRELLQEWKKNPSLMSRFDRDGNGQIDPKEWEAARRAAEYKVKRDYEEELRGRILNTLSKPPLRSHPYLISTLPEFDLVRRYKVIAAFSLAVFLGCGSGAAWMWLGRFG